MTLVLITGTGLVGEHLARRLLKKGYKVAFLSRQKNQKSSIQIYSWDLDRNRIDSEAIAAADYIVHLAGANIGEKRWTDIRKQHIIDSRVNSSGLIFQEVRRQDKKLKAFISASATGYYGAVTSEKIFSETDSPANDFLGRTCRLWEQAADKFEDSGIRTVKIRTGVVLTTKGGALAKMMTPVKMGIGSAIGSGKQYLPWIHVDDLCSIFIRTIEDSEMEGAYNAVAPEHRTNKQFTRQLAKVLHKPFWFPNIPTFTMKLMFGEMATILLNGSRVSSEKIESTGFKFKYPNLEIALINLLKK